MWWDSMKRTDWLSGFLTVYAKLTTLFFIVISLLFGRGGGVQFSLNLTLCSNMLWLKNMRQNSTLDIFLWITFYRDSLELRSSTILVFSLTSYYRDLGHCSSNIVFAFNFSSAFSLFLILQFISHFSILNCKIIPVQWNILSIMVFFAHAQNILLVCSVVGLNLSKILYRRSSTNGKWFNVDCRLKTWKSPSSFVLNINYQCFMTLIMNALLIKYSFAQEFIMCFSFFFHSLWVW